MKIVFLNVWNARMKLPMAEFIRRQAADTDVFCLQEVYGRSARLFDGLLPGFRRSAAGKFLSPRDMFAQATYVRRGSEAGDPMPIFDRRPRRCGLGLSTPVWIDGAVVNAVNFHGLPRPGAKTDDADRIRQSRGLIDFCAALPGPKIIGGDFNILPDTASVGMFAANGYQDLIADFGVKTTRNHLAWDKYPGNELYFSDYVFASPELEIGAFGVPNLEISDHLPMIVEARLRR